VQYLDLMHLAEADWIQRSASDWERRVRLVYMDVAPESAKAKGAVLLVHGKNFSVRIGLESSRCCAATVSAS
jgi:hypothetical protein